MAIQYNFLKPIDQKVRDQGYDFVSKDEYLRDGFKSTDGISYEGDGSPVSYANSMGGIMSQAPIPGPLKYIPPEGDGDDDDDPKDPKNPKGPTMSPLNALKNAGLFMLNPLGYLATKAFGAYRSRQKAKADAIADADYKAQRERDAREMIANPNNSKTGLPAAYNYAGRENNQGVHTSTISEKDSQSNIDDARSKRADGGRAGYFFGGRAGYFFGGRVNYKKGGEIEGPGDTGGEGGENPEDKSDTQFGGGDNNINNGGGIKPTLFNNPEILNTKTIFGDMPTGIGFDNPYGRYKAAMDLRNSIKNKNVEGEIEYNNTVGDVNFGGKYDTQDGVTYGGSYEKNGVGVEYDNINGVKASVEKGPFSLSTDGKNSMLNFTLQLGKKNGGRIGFKNGGLASIL